jgi:hypothetical protein
VTKASAAGTVPVTRAVPARVAGRGRRIGLLAGRGHTGNKVCRKYLKTVRAHTPRHLSPGSSMDVPSEERRRFERRPGVPDEEDIDDVLCGVVLLPFAVVASRAPCFSAPLTPNLTPNFTQTLHLPSYLHENAMHTVIQSPLQGIPRCAEPFQ